MNDVQKFRASRAPRLKLRGNSDTIPRVIAVNRFYWPDVSATSQLLTDLMHTLADEGWQDLTVITSRMRYDDPGIRLDRNEFHSGIRIRRVWSARHFWRRLRGRMLEYLSFYCSAFAALLFEVRRDDVVLVTTDPPLFSVLASLATRMKRAHLVTWNHDLYPEVAGALGVPLGRGRLGKLLRILRNRVLRSAVENIVISPAMADHVGRELGSSDRISIIRNWCDEAIQPVPHLENSLRDEWGLNGSFVIGYSGNLGRVHIPSRVADLVGQSLDVEGLRWLFIGGGIGLDQVRSVAAQAPSGTVQFRPYQDREDLSRSLSVPDLHLVSLDPNCEGLTYPSKLYGILAAGRPTLFFGDPMSEVSADLARHRIGVTLDQDQPGSWCNKILELVADREELRAMGARARARHEFIARQPGLLAWESVLANPGPVAVEPAVDPVRGT
jgi:glycosyltransferase involved in cell wall biosynthesis